MNAKEYKKLTAARQKTEELKLPSGGIFEMRLAPIQQWTATGVLPAGLAVKMEAVSKAKNKTEANNIVLRHFTEQDFVDSQNVNRRMLEYCCVRPRVILLGPGESPRELGELELYPEDIPDEDFETILGWIWSGGKQGESLAKFSRKSRQPSKPRPHR